MSSTPSHTNQLIHESSPYLLQHAHNPVDWYPWKDELKARAEREDKLLLISIGYSACHWCHVMEKECFEDEQVAELMNAHFICVKVDREERPDIDQVYMNAVQLMTGHGGWPLNCITLADGKPIYGGTYFPKESWTSVLKKIIELKTHDRPRMLEYAEKLTLGVQQSELIAANKSKIDFTRADLDDLFYNWSKLLDNQEGGPDRAPKFPLPNNYQFLLRFAHLSKNKELENHVKLTLNKIAFGGIYDHLGGGFARYSVDAFWKVPHFEKMLYDNAQLVSLFAEAYQAYPDPLYKKVVAETLKFVAEELQSPQGGFYSALDADSEGVEGKYYTWTKNELQELLATDFELFAHAYSVDERGYWEDGQYILLRKESLESLAQRHDLTLELLHEKLEKCKNILLTERSKRVKPGLDDKILCSWNALMIKGLADAYRVFGDKAYLHSAENAFQFLLKNMQDRERLSHSFKNGKATINGFLEDYAFLIEACISLYEATFNATYLHQAKTLMAYCLKHFSSSESEFLFFTSDEDSPLIARKSETSDNVIPASNSSIAKSLFLLGHFFDENLWIEKSANMLHQVKHLMIRYGSGYSNWAQLQLMQVFPFYELVISGADAESLRAEVERHYFPNKLMLGSSIAGDLPLLKNKWVADKTFIYLCINKTCQLPVDNVAAAFLQLEQE